MDERVTESKHGSDDGYVVVARRYRPTSFGELIGQQQVSQALRNAITSHRVGHAYLFTGARGVGKTSTARIFGKALNCVQGPTPDPCNVCDICRSVASGEDVDVLEIDGASNRGIEEIRQLRSTVSVRPSRGRFKVYIIDEVHMLTTPAFNALLKTLEEPPEHVKFIFCTTDPEKIPITVLSRCQRFDFPPVRTSEIQERLRQIVELEGVQADVEALALLARRAAGSMRDSQSLLEQLLSFCDGRITVDDVHRMLGTARGGRLGTILEALVARDVPGALAEVEQAIQEGVDAGQLAEQLLQTFRDLLVLAHGGRDEALIGPMASEAPRLREIVKVWGAATCLGAMQILDQTISRMRQSLHARILLEMAMVRLAALSDLEGVDRLVKLISQGGGAESLGRLASSPARLPEGASKKNDLTDRSAAVVSSVSAAPVAMAAGAPVAAPITPPAAVVGSGHSPSVMPGTTALRAANPEGTRLVSGLGLGAAADQGSQQRPGTGPSPGVRPSEVDRGGSKPAGAASFGATPAGSMVRRPLQASNVESIWREAIEGLEEPVRELARDFSRVSLGPNGTLVVVLRSLYNKEACDRPERRARLEEVLREMTGERLRLEFQVMPAPPRPMSGSSMVNRRLMLREAQQHPWVAEAMTQFDGEVLEVKPPRRG